ncbi:MAG: hypothetical protein LBL17_02420 [Coxiellaceae bacterium]|jgi:hypothetical protein|nr:hypothetical protein [Coxiellaceae bacterium]
MLVIASAYVDPGFLSSIYQVFYVVIFGAVFTWVVTPWKYVKSLFRRIKCKNKECNESNVVGNRVGTTPVTNSEEVGGNIK